MVGRDFRMCFLVVALTVFVATADAQTYSVTDLGIHLYPIAINNDGDVISDRPNYIRPTTGWMHSDGETYLDNPIGGSYFYSFYCFGDFNLDETPNGGGSVQTTGFNYSGQIAGTWLPSIGRHRLAIYTCDARTGSGSWTDLGMPVEGGFANGGSINSSGQIAGLACWDVDCNNTGNLGAFIYPGWTRIPSTDASPTDINDLGQVVGDMAADGGRRAYVWSGGALQILGSLGGYGPDGNSSATGINNSGVIVGSVGRYLSGRAFIYRAGQGMVDLNTLLPPNSGWTITDAYGINDAGQIIARGVNPQLPPEPATGYTDHGLLLSPTASPPTHFRAVQHGDNGLTIQLTWKYEGNPITGFEVVRKPPLGGEYVIPLDTSVCDAGSPRSCSYVDGAITPYGTYTYKIRAVQGGDYSPYSKSRTVYQLQIGSGGDPATLTAKFTPDPNAASLHDVAVSLGYDHFNWVQAMVYGPSCGVLHPWDPNTPYLPKMGSALIGPHLDPPIDGYFEYGFVETGGDGPSDSLGYYWHENPSPGSPGAWYLDQSHMLNPGADLSSVLIGGDPTTSNWTSWWGRPQTPCLPDWFDPTHRPSDYMSFVTTLVGVRPALNATKRYSPTLASDALASFMWFSNYNGKTGGIKTWGWPTSTPRVYDGTGGIFNVARIEVNDLDMAVVIVLNEARVRSNPAVNAPYRNHIAPMTAAFLSGIQGTNGWYTGPVQVTLFATSLSPDIDNTTYSLDGGASTLYVAPLRITDDGVHTLIFHSTDRQQYSEIARSQTISIDQTAPTSHVALLPASQRATNFTVEWSGSDTGSGIQDFTIYVSDNGGAFSPFLRNSATVATTFNGQSGHTYAFYSIARDLAGHVEAAKSAAEATTTVPVPDFRIEPVSGGTASATVAAGSSAVYNLELTAIGAFSGPVTFACSGLPKAATCSFSPAEATLSGAAALPFTVTVATTAWTTTNAATTTDRPGYPGYRSGPAALAYTFALGALMMIAAVRRRRQFALAAVVLTLATAGLVGCGFHPAGTRITGTYTIVVTATSGTLTHDIKLTLTVQ